jgi:hypothetical protein
VRAREAGSLVTCMSHWTGLHSASMVYRALTECFHPFCALPTAFVETSEFSAVRTVFPHQAVLVFAWRLYRAYSCSIFVVHVWDHFWYVLESTTCVR